MEKKYVVTKDEPYGLVSLQIDDGDVHAFGGIPSIQKFRAEDCPDLPEAIFHELLARDGGFILQQSENGWKAENTRFASYTLPDSFESPETAWEAASAAATRRFAINDAEQRCAMLAGALAAKYPDAGLYFGRIVDGQPQPHVYRPDDELGGDEKWGFFTSIPDNNRPGAQHGFGIMALDQGLPGLAQRAEKHLNWWLRERLGLPHEGNTISAAEARAKMQQQVEEGAEAEPLTLREMEALAAFRGLKSSKGSNWKEVLGDCWWSGNYPRSLSINQQATLQSMRNNRGPEWLESYQEPGRAAPSVAAPAPLLKGKIRCDASQGDFLRAAGVEVGDYVDAAGAFAVRATQAILDEVQQFPDFQFEADREKENAEAPTPAPVRTGHAAEECLAP